MAWNKSDETIVELRPKGVKVPPRRIKQIRAIAHAARDLFEITEPRVDVISLYEVVLHQMGVVYEISEKSELANDHGLTFPNESLIQIREDVYEGSHEDSGRDRFTMIHEVGHLILHDNVAFSRSSGNHKWIEDSEWQADTFAAEFMMPVQHLLQLCTSYRDVVHVFGVSNEAAKNRWRKLEEQHIISQ